MNKYLRFAWPALAVGLAACSATQGDTVAYKSRSEPKIQKLDVPPDVTQLFRADRYVVAGATVSASSYQTSPAAIASAPSTAASSMGDVRIERSGSQRWLVVGRSPDQLWAPVRDFWQESGFLLTTDERDAGILETDWAENRARLPQDIVRGTVGKLTDSGYATTEVDRFRTRIERTSQGTEIYVSHRGMVEVLASGQKDQPAQWQPRPIDPELEAEFLRRLMMKLGASQEQPGATASAAEPTRRSRVTTVKGQPVLQIDDAADRAWRRVGLALDRTGFTVEDRDRSAGVYFVRYVNPEKKDQGIFSKMLSFGRTPAEAPLKYRIAVQSQGDTSTVSVLDDAGAPDATQNAQRIVQVIADDLR